MTDPKRLLDDPQVSAALREDLRAAKNHKPAYDVAAGLAALHTALDASVAAGGQAVAQGAATAGTQAGASGQVAAAAKVGAGAAATKAGAATVGAKLAGVTALGKAAAALGLVTASAVGVQMMSPGAPAPTAPPQVAPAAQTVGVPALPAPTAPAPTAPAPSVPATGEDTAVPPVAEPAVRLGMPAQGARDAPRRRRLGEGAGELRLRRETSQLARLKRTVHSDPGAALALAEAGHRRFPNGLFRPEREGLAVVALSELGRTREARRRGRAWLARYPTSPIRPQVEAALADSGSPVEAP